MSTPSYFSFNLTKQDETDVQVVSLKDSRTGFEVKTAIANPEKQTPSLMAFAGARYSRSDQSVENILKEIKNSGKNAQEKLAAIFRNYGHASVADMAQLFVYIENIPQLYATKFFYQTSLGGGQERSTRYQDFGNIQPENIYSYLSLDQQSDLENDPKVKNLNQKFTGLQKLSLELYQKWTQKLTQKYIQVYNIDTDKKSQISALTARVFDTSRYFLLNGVCNRTSLGWVTSAREWARIVSTFKSEKDKQLNSLAEQLEYLLAPDSEEAKKINYLPEAPDLIRHTKADETTEDNLEKLKEFLESINFKETAKFNQNFLKYQNINVQVFDESFLGSQKAILQLILTIYPNLNETWLFGWLKQLSKETKAKLSKIIFKGFNHHKQMGNQFRVNTKSFLLDCSIAEARDLNRHRAWGRFIPALSIQDNYEKILEDGYSLPLYLTDNQKLTEEKGLFEKDLQDYYLQFKEFIKVSKNVPIFPKSLYLQLLPFASNMRMWLHGSIKEISYMTNLRVRPGGHINYRHLAYLISKEATQNDPLLQYLELDKAPDSCSREEFLDRG